MSGFGKAKEVTDGPLRKLFTGAENFRVVAVNPTKEEIESLYGREIQYTPEYMGKTEVEDGDGKREVDQIRLDFFLSNEDDSITTKAQFYVAKTHHKSQTGKLRIVNDFGKTAWLEKDAIASKTVPDNMGWYNTSGLKIALRGEEELISFLANLLNLPFDLSKLEDKSDAFARISQDEWLKIFSGDVSLIRGIIESTNNKVGLILGVKTKQDGGLVQTVFNRTTLRQYTIHSTKADKFKWILKDILDAKAAGAFGNVEFGPDDLELREFSINPSQLTMGLAEGADVFDTSVNAEAQMDASLSDDWLREN
tara:strand:- start:48808 stop:49734 length:927 start_codon:yes stop_codon:yes gene_type:complete